jgi:perosamine synthetase
MKFNMLLMQLQVDGFLPKESLYKNLKKVFAQYCGTEHCVLVANGTVALHLALEVLGIGKGDEVIIPDLTFVATANIVKMAGGTPVLADVKMDSWCIDPDDVKRKITSKTKAIIPVHIYGHPADMDQLQQIANENNLVLIEDAAEAHGALYNGKKVGSMSTMASFSFFGNKIITTGEDGAITTNSAELADRARFLRDHGMSRTKRYWYTEVGYNYRMTNMQAALGLAQMNSIDLFIEQRAEILNAYKEFLNGVNLIRFNAKLVNSEPVNWITCLVIEDF